MALGISLLGGGVDAGEHLVDEAQLTGEREGREEVVVSAQMSLF